jgi:hypothetical protein
VESKFQCALAAMLLSATAFAEKVAPRGTIAHTSGISLAVPAQWSYSADHVAREDVWEVITVGTQGSSPNRGTFISLSSAKMPGPVPSENQTITTLQRVGRPLNFEGPAPNTEADHVDKFTWSGQLWFVREISTRDGPVWYATAYRKKMLFSIFARADRANADAMRNLMRTSKLR